MRRAVRHLALLAEPGIVVKTGQCDVNEPVRRRSERLGQAPAAIVADDVTTAVAATWSGVDETPTGVVRMQLDMTRGPTAHSACRLGDEGGGHVNIMLCSTYCGGSWEFFLLVMPPCEDAPVRDANDRPG